MGVNSLSKTVTRQGRGCDLNPGPSAPESSTLITRLPSHPFDVSDTYSYVCIYMYYCTSFIINNNNDSEIGSIDTLRRFCSRSFSCDIFCRRQELIIRQRFRFNRRSLWNASKSFESANKWSQFLHQTLEAHKLGVPSLCPVCLVPDIHLWRHAFCPRWMHPYLNRWVARVCCKSARDWMTAARGNSTQITDGCGVSCYVSPAASLPTADPWRPAQWIASVNPARSEATWPFVSLQHRQKEGEGIRVLVASLLIWSITQSSEPNQRTNDATCWPNPWTEWAGSGSSHAHQTRSRVHWLSSRRPGPVHPSAQRGGSLCSQAFHRPAHSRETRRRIYSTERTMTQSYGWNLQRLQHSRNNTRQTDRQR